jgi:ABC-type multidrug transport system fused ATPase/permease subunit
MNTMTTQQSFELSPAWQTFGAIDDPSRATPGIEFRHVEFSYGDRPILNDVSFQIMRGETLLVLSGSGGGKSTILNLVMGLTKPDSGQILIEGEDTTGYDESELNRVRLKMGMQFQNGALFDSPGKSGVPKRGQQSRQDWYCQDLAGNS